VVHSKLSEKTNGTKSSVSFRGEMGEYRLQCMFSITSLRYILPIQFSVVLDLTILVCNRENVNDCDGNLQFSQPFFSLRCLYESYEIFRYIEL
jgi:hypothetical protein